MSINVAIPVDRNVIKKEAEMILKYKDLTIEINRMWNVKAKSDTDNKSRYLNYLKITQTIPEKHIGHIGHCTQTAESGNIKVQNKFHGRNNIMCNTNCK